MSEVFCASYADAYDTLYHDKDYVGECDQLEQIFRQYGEGPTCTVLDLGCGTGSHALILADRGCEVVGIDRSASMIDHARCKAASHPAGHRSTFNVGDLRDFHQDRTFDAALMMFAVLSYQLGNAEVMSALRTVRRHLRPAGLFVADVWYGPAVLSQRPAQVVKVCALPDGEMLRTSRGTLDARRHTCQVDFNVWRVEGDRVAARTAERHTVRYFHPMELELFLDVAGFELLRLGAFPDFRQPADESTWNAFLIARARRD